MIPLRRKLLLAFAGLALVPITVIGLLVTFGVLRFAERRAEEDLGRRLRSLTDLIESELQAERLLLGRTAAELALGAKTDAGWASEPERRLNLLTDRLRLASRVVGLDPAGETGWVVERRAERAARRARHQPFAAVTLPASNWARAVTSGAPPGAPVAFTELRSTGPLVSVAAVSDTAAEYPTVVLIEEVPLIALIERILERPSLRDLEQSFVVARIEGSASWTTLYHADLTRVGLPFSEPGLLASNGDRVRFSRSGTRLTATVPHPFTGWQVGVSVSIAPLLVSFRQNLALFLVMLGLIAVMVVAGILHVTRGVGDDVTRIADATVAISRGDFGRTIRLGRRDEFSVIADHVNRMAQELRITAETRAVTSTRAQLVHDLKGIVSQMKLLLHNLKENFDDAEFRAEFFPLMQGLIEHVESLGLKLRRGEHAGAPDLAPVDLDDLVGEVLDGALLTANPGVAVDRRLAAGEPVRTHAESLAGVVENIVSNAVEAMEGRGTLRVRTGRTRDAEVTHFIEVQDTGPGMTREFVEVDLFRPFATTKDKGIGLGMYQSRKTLDRLGGRIRVSSQPGEGTLVRIEIGAPARPGDEHGRQ